MILEKYKGKAVLINGKTLAKIIEVNHHFVTLQVYGERKPMNWNINNINSIEAVGKIEATTLNTFWMTMRDALGGTIVLSLLLYFFYCFFAFTFFNPFSEFFLVGYSFIFAACSWFATILNSDDNTKKMADYQNSVKFCRTR